MPKKKKLLLAEKMNSEPTGQTLLTSGLVRVLSDNAENPGTAKLTLASHQGRFAHTDNEPLGVSQSVQQQQCTGKHHRSFNHGQITTKEKQNHGSPTQFSTAVLSKVKESAWLISPQSRVRRKFYCHRDTNDS